MSTNNTAGEQSPLVIDISNQNNNNQEPSKSNNNNNSNNNTNNTTINLPDGYSLLNTTPYQWNPPEDQSLHPYQPHQGEGSQYLRDFILGINDGLISTLLLVVTMVGGGANSREILLAGIAGAIAGSIAMGLGEYIATKSQNQVVEGEISLEREHFKYHKDQEIAQLRSHFIEIGMDGPLLEAAVRKVAESDDNLMKIMEKFEFGAEANKELERSPLKAMFMSGRLFFMGALPSIVPFIQSNVWMGFYIACSLCAIALFAVGVYKTKTTRGNPWTSGFENFLCGVFGAGFSYCVGLLFDLVHS